MRPHFSFAEPWIAFETKRLVHCYPQWWPRCISRSPAPVLWPANSMSLLSQCWPERRCRFSEYPDIIIIIIIITILLIIIIVTKVDPCVTSYNTCHHVVSMESYCRCYSRDSSVSVLCKKTDSSCCNNCNNSVVALTKVFFVFIIYRLFQMLASHVTSRKRVLLH